MRPDVFVLFTAFLGPAAAYRRTCSHTGKGEGWYIIRRGDNFNAVAADFCTSTNVLTEWNHISTITDNMVNTKIKVPCRWNAGKQRDCLKDQKSSNGWYHIVSGDELKDIAYDFCTTSGSLAGMNGISNPDYIKANTDIVVPCSWN
ncbi:uncharacterized protein VDAG_05180 [Verticillium dahliae VdLs.17]|uniref:Secreted LysM effector Vd2LysM n=1 Tax=Verticillium dahliae (strain VdLs.17 / ATCC MYA-4575 / FGSC 10137) TaxID=498257 RepID=LYSM2_VERDV|nr:uncharacterized protein VDAG_05180 [Verticillium dahliae VdLs.17]EGY23742.1 hypothetical protein VDAG_05180 [Verticillium dahliae VdLs.17]